MADPMRIRAQAQGGNAVVRVLMSHEMETGQRKDSAGKTIPAWHITDVTATHNGKPVLNAEWGPAVAKNPFLQFTIIHTAASHLSKPSGLSSKIVPTLTENCLRWCALLHCHFCWFSRNVTSLRPHVGQITPSGHLFATR